MIDPKDNLGIHMPISDHNQIFCNHQNPWKDVIDYVSKFTRHYCVGLPATDRNKILWLAIINQTIRVFSNYHPHAPNFFDGWQLQFFYSGLDQPGNLTVIAVDRNMIGHDLTELAQKEYK